MDIDIDTPETELSIIDSENKLELDPPKNPTTIRHIVLSGGGAQGLSFYGFLREANRAGLWNIRDIQTVHGTSIGAFIVTILCMDFEWEVLDDFLVKRPWHTVLKLDLPAYFRVFENKGMVPKTVYEDVMKPLFAAKDIPLDVTMRGFYEITGVELHVYATEMNQLEIVDISHKTHPDWPVTKALHCTSNLPIVFEPYIENDCIYLDGGILVNYPIRQCISNGADPDEILGIYKRNTIYENKISAESSFFDYILGLLNRIFERIVNYTEGGRPEIPHQYYVVDEVVNINNLVATTSSMEERQRLIQIGVDLAAKHLQG